MSRPSALPCFGLILVFVSGLDLVVMSPVAQPLENVLLPKIFNLLDKNHNGSLDFNEFKYLVLLIKDGTSDNTVEYLFKFADKNGNQKINEPEFITVVSSIANTILHYIDQNGDSTITAKEVGTYYGMSEKEAQEILDHARENNGGKVSPYEFMISGYQELLSYLEETANNGEEQAAAL